MSRDVQGEKADREQCEWATTHGLLQGEAAEEALDDLDVGRRLRRKKCTDRLEEVREPRWRTRLLWPGTRVRSQPLIGTQRLSSRAQRVALSKRAGLCGTSAGRPL